VCYESLLVINRQSFAEIRFYVQLHWDIPVLAETLSELWSLSRRKLSKIRSHAV